jgi:threonine dehydrogenase-like Zn-dependent dehydrogenase
MNHFHRRGQARDRPNPWAKASDRGCRKGGRISIPGVYGGVTDKFPIGALMKKGLSVKSGQTHVQKYMPELLNLILRGTLDTTFLISHRLSLEQAPEGYKMFKERQNEVTKVVLKPNSATRH